jgi:PE-PPE domain
LHNQRAALAREGVVMNAATVTGSIGKIRTGLVKVLAATAVTATAMAASMAAPATIPTARALDLNAVTTGPLFRVAEALGIYDVTFDNVPVLGTVTIHFGYTNSDPVNLNDQINDFPFGGFTPIAATFARQPGGNLGVAFLAGSGIASYNTTQAYLALLSSARGNTQGGHSALVPSGRVNTLTGAPCTSGIGCVQGINQTNLALLLANNPGTPNGGLYARFAPLLSRFGIDAVTPVGSSASSLGLSLNTAQVNVALGYNALSDFPETLNPFSLTNTLLATFLPTYLLGGSELDGASLNTIETNLGLLAALGTTSTSYSTFVSSDLPLLEPLRLPSRIINGVLGALGSSFRLGTPLADALQPALSILVNTGYTDVQTPTAGGTYNRTYDQSGVYTPFLSVRPLTGSEWLQVPGDVVRALVAGFQNAFPILRFGKPPAVLVPSGNHLTITYPAPSSAGVTPIPPAAGTTMASIDNAVRTPTAKPASSGVANAAASKRKPAPAAAKSTKQLRGPTTSAAHASRHGSTK